MVLVFVSEGGGCGEECGLEDVNNGAVEIDFLPIDGPNNLANVSEISAIIR